MTTEECMANIEKVTRQYHEEVKQAELMREKRMSIELQRWVEDNARFKVGDILQSFDTIIQVTKRYGFYSPTSVNMIQTTYYGPALTKQLKPRKDGWNTVIYDDGREIKILTRKERRVKGMGNV